MTRRQHLELLLTRVQRELAEERTRERRRIAAAAAIEPPADETPDCEYPSGRPRKGRPRADVWSKDEARVAHSMYAAGNREDWVIEAERQYQRDRKRASRERLEGQESA